MICTAAASLRVYQVCIKLQRNQRFLRNRRLEESITYVSSISGGGSIPTAPTKLLDSQRLNFPFNNNKPFNNN